MNHKTIISEAVEQRTNLITAIINKKQAINQVVYTSDQWHIEYAKLAPLHIDELKRLAS